MSEPEHTPVTFAPAELGEIREMLAANGPVSCPKCGGKLASGGVFDARDSQQDVWALVCEPCNRMAILRDVTDIPG